MIDTGTISKEVAKRASWMLQEQLEELVYNLAQDALVQRGYDVLDDDFQEAALEVVSQVTIGVHK